MSKADVVRRVVNEKDADRIPIVGTCDTPSRDKGRKPSAIESNRRTLLETFLTGGVPKLQFYFDPWFHFDDSHVEINPNRWILVERNLDLLLLLRRQELTGSWEKTPSQKLRNNDD